MESRSAADSACLNDTLVQGSSRLIVSLASPMTSIGITHIPAAKGRLLGVGPQSQLQGLAQSCKAELPRGLGA